MVAPHEEYLGTINRIEPDIAPIDAAAFYASASISLKRIADALENIQSTIFTYVDSRGK